MIVHVASRGHSFKGAGQYYLHDKKADTSERVAWAQTHNLPTDDPEKGLRWMAHTSMNAEQLKGQAGVARTGRKARAGSVYAFALSWHPEQNPDREEMQRAAFDTLERLRLQEHEAVMVAHRDTGHPHVHVIVNLVSPKDGRTAVPSYDRLTLSTWAQEHEMEEGKIYCEERVKNNEQRREQAKEGRETGMVKHREKRHETAETIQGLYSRSDSGKAFQAALSGEGFTLAKGDRRGFVLVDQEGKIYSLSRQLQGQRAKDINARLSDLDQEALPMAKDVAEERQYFDRDKYDAEWQERIVDAGIEWERTAEKKKGEQGRQGEKPAETRAEPAHENPYLAELDRLREWEQSQDRKRHRLEKELAEFYGREQVVEKMNTLTGQLEKGPSLWGKVTGKTQVLEEELNALKANLANIDQRIGERRSSLEIEIQKSREKEFPAEGRAKQLEIEQRRDQMRQRKLALLRKQADKKIDHREQGHDLSQ